MIFDIPYKLFRKAIPSGLFARLAGALGRDKNYHRPATYRAIRDFYHCKGLNFRDKIVMEVGPGRQLFTAFHHLVEGARLVLVADPKVDPSSAQQQLEQFNMLYGHLLGLETIQQIQFYRHSGEIPETMNGSVDLMCSHNVLEHIPDLKGFYTDVVRLLSSNGSSCHRVDVSDHTYHLFSKFGLGNFGHRRGLFHLRYSERAFRLLGDDKTYMNRRLLPYHLDLIRRAGLRVSTLQRTAFMPVPIHPDLLAGLGPQAPEDLYLTDFFICITK